METEAFEFKPTMDGVFLIGNAVISQSNAFAWKENDQVRSVVWTRPGPESRFAKQTSLSARSLGRSLAIEAVWLAPGAGLQDLAPALYRALQHGRIHDCNTVVTHLRDPQDSLVGRALQLHELNAAPLEEGGETHVAVAQMLDVAIHHAARHCSADAWQELRKGLSREAIATVRRWVDEGFFRGPWANSVFDKTMTREQYVQSLSNMHHYVRQTTQHLGRAVANSQDRGLRRHLIGHLNGEINHEISIENDLRHLGEDVEYLTSHRTPHPATRAFMAIQESTIGFYHDPMLFMACPLVAEGLTANLPERFVSLLRELMVSWGVEKPERAMTFIASHVHTDGGDDGHWEATAAMLDTYLLDESIQRRFLCVVRTAADLMERCFNVNVEDFALFSEAAQQGNRMGRVSNG